MMLGILSDTHGRADRAHAALRLLDERGATHFVHCGDVCGTDVLAALAGRNAWFVWGNMDLESVRDAEFARTLGLSTPASIPVQMEIAGKRMAIFHGHEPEFARWLGLAQRGERDALRELAGGPLDYVFYGHTHQADDDRVAGVRWINPGALQRARQYSVALLDVSRDSLQFLSVPEGRAFDPADLA